MDDAGVPAYDELVLVANEDALERDGGTIRAFIGALSRGVRDLQRDPDDALDGLLEANPDLDPGLQRARSKVTLPLFSPPEGKPYGWQDPAAVGRVRGLDEGQPAAREGRPTRARRSRTSCCRAPGSSAAAV